MAAGYFRPKIAPQISRDDLTPPAGPAQAQPKNTRLLGCAGKTAQHGKRRDAKPAAASRCIKCGKAPSEQKDVPRLPGEKHGLRQGEEPRAALTGWPRGNDPVGFGPPNQPVGAGCPATGMDHLVPGGAAGHRQAPVLHLMQSGCGDVPAPGGHRGFDRRFHSGRYFLPGARRFTAGT